MEQSASSSRDLFSENGVSITLLKIGNGKAKFHVTCDASKVVLSGTGLFGVSFAKDDSPKPDMELHEDVDSGWTADLTATEITKTMEFQVRVKLVETDQKVSFS